MKNQILSRSALRVSALGLLAGAALLSGCVAVPVAPAYSDGYAYGAPYPYYGYPAVSVGVGYYGGYYGGGCCYRSGYYGGGRGYGHGGYGRGGYGGHGDFGGHH